LKGGIAVSNAKIIGQRLKYYRKLNLLTQKQLAAKIGVKALHISNIELGRRGISLDKLIEICRLFNINLSDISPMIGKKDESIIKELWIGEIVSSLRVLDAAQVKVVKTMVGSLK
jgi:transcriptional regulator with XRE-family HTH domain